MHDTAISGSLIPVRQIFRIQKIEIILILRKRNIAGINRDPGNVRIEGPGIGKKIVHIGIEIFVAPAAVIRRQITLECIIHIEHIGDCIITVCLFIQILAGMFHLIGKFLIKTLQLNPLRIAVSKDSDEKHGKKGKECIVKHQFKLHARIPHPFSHLKSPFSSGHSSLRSTASQSFTVQRITPFSSCMILPLQSSL